MVGGRMRPNTLGVVDYWATRMLSGLSINLAFIGANAIDDDGYLSTPRRDCRGRQDRRDQGLESVDRHRRPLEVWPVLFRQVRPSFAGRVPHHRHAPARGHRPAVVGFRRRRRSGLVAFAGPLRAPLAQLPPNPHTSVMELRTRWTAWPRTPPSAYRSSCSARCVRRVPRAMPPRMRRRCARRGQSRWRARPRMARRSRSATRRGRR